MQYQHNKNPHIPDAFAGLNKEHTQVEVDPGLIHVGGSGLWQNWVKTGTREQSIKHHQLKVLKQWCKEEAHFWEDKSSTDRIGVCKECKMERPYILGKHKIKDGKFLIKIKR